MLRIAANLTINPKTNPQLVNFSWGSEPGEA